MSQDEKISFSSNEKNPEPDIMAKPKKILTDYFSRSSPQRREMLSKIIQTDEVVGLLDEIISEAPPENYWSKLAEKKRVELEEALAENERLFKLKDSLLQQNCQYKLMLEEANTFITVFKEVVDGDADDTGIDVKDFNDSNEN